MPFSLFVLAFGVFIMGTAEFVVVGISHIISVDLSIPLSSTGLLVTFFSIGLMLGGLIGPSITRLAKPKSLLILLTVTFAAANIIGSITHLYYLILFMRLVMGLSYGVFFTIALSMVGTLVVKEKQTQGIALIIFGLIVSLVVGVPFGTWIGSLISWQATFWSIAIAAIISIFSILLFIPKIQNQMTNKSAFKEQVSIHLNLSMIKVYITTFVALFAFSSVFTYIVPLLQYVFFVKNKYITIIMLLFGAAGGIGNIISGKMGDKIGTKKSLILNFSAFFIILLLLALVKNQIFGLLLSFTFAVTVFGIAPLIYSHALYILHLTGKKNLEEAVNGMVLIFISLGLIAGSFFAGIIFKHLGLVMIPLIASGFAFIALILTISRKTIN